MSSFLKVCRFPMADFAGPAWRLPAAPGFSSPPEILRSPQSVESSCSSQDNVLNHTEMYGNKKIFTLRTERRNYHGTLTC
ncbi:uncharacterized protein FN964_015752 isoform 3-T3 [Alca torda]